MLAPEIVLLRRALGARSLWKPLVHRNKMPATSIVRQNRGFSQSLINPNDAANVAHTINPKIETNIDEILSPLGNSELLTEDAIRNMIRKAAEVNEGFTVFLELIKKGVVIPEAIPVKYLKIHEVLARGSLIEKNYLVRGGNRSDSSNLWSQLKVEEKDVIEKQFPSNLLYELISRVYIPQQKPGIALQVLDILHKRSIAKNSFAQYYHNRAEMLCDIAFTKPEANEIIRFQNVAEMELFIEEKVARYGLNMNELSPRMRNSIQTSALRYFINLTEARSRLLLIYTCKAFWGFRKVLLEQNYCHFFRLDKDSLKDNGVPVSAGPEFMLPDPHLFFDFWRKVLAILKPSKIIEIAKMVASSPHSSLKNQVFPGHGVFAEIIVKKYAVEYVSSYPELAKLGKSFVQDAGKLGDLLACPEFRGKKIMDYLALVAQDRTDKQRYFKVRPQAVNIVFQRTQEENFGIVLEQLLKAGFVVSDRAFEFHRKFEYFLEIYSSPSVMRIVKGGANSSLSEWNETREAIVNQYSFEMVRLILRKSTLEPEIAREYMDILHHKAKTKQEIVLAKETEIMLFDKPKIPLVHLNSGEISTASSLNEFVAIMEKYVSENCLPTMSAETLTAVKDRHIDYLVSRNVTPDLLTSFVLVCYPKLVGNFKELGIFDYLNVDENHLESLRNITNLGYFYQTESFIRAWLVREIYKQALSSISHDKVLVEQLLVKLVQLTKTRDFDLWFLKGGSVGTEFDSILGLEIRTPDGSTCKIVGSTLLKTLKPSETSPFDIGRFNERLSVKNRKNFLNIVPQSFMEELFNAIPEEQVYAAFSSFVSNGFGCRIAPKVVEKAITDHMGIGRSIDEKVNLPDPTDESLESEKIDQLTKLYPVNILSLLVERSVQIDDSEKIHKYHDALKLNLEANKGYDELEGLDFSKAYKRVLYLVDLQFDRKFFSKSDIAEIKKNDFGMQIVVDKIKKSIEKYNFDGEEFPTKSYFGYLKKLMHLGASVEFQVRFVSLFCPKFGSILHELGFQEVFKLKEKSSVDISPLPVNNDVPLPEQLLAFYKDVLSDRKFIGDETYLMLFERFIAVKLDPAYSEWIEPILQDVIHWFVVHAQKRKEATYGIYKILKSQGVEYRGRRSLTNNVVMSLAETDPEMAILRLKEAQNQGIILRYGTYATLIKVMMSREMNDEAHQLYVELVKHYPPNPIADKKFELSALAKSSGWIREADRARGVSRDRMPTNAVGKTEKNNASSKGWNRERGGQSGRSVRRGSNAEAGPKDRAIEMKVDKFKVKLYDYDQLNT